MARQKRGRWEIQREKQGKEMWGQRRCCEMLPKKQDVMELR